MLTPNTNRSLIKYLRRKLDIAGATEHNGRGSYIMDTDITGAEIVDRVERLIKDNPELIEEHGKDEYTLAVLFKEEYFESHYRHINVPLNGYRASIGVHFTMPSDISAMLS